MMRCATGGLDRREPLLTATVAGLRPRVDDALSTPADGLLDGLRKAREHHNDDCLFCAVKDTAIDALLGRKP